MARRCAKLEAMPNLQIIVAIMLPFLLGMGGFAAWRASRRSDEPQRERAAPRRAASPHDRRKGGGGGGGGGGAGPPPPRRASGEEAQTHAGSTREGDEKKQHQRIGG